MFGDPAILEDEDEDDEMFRGFTTYEPGGGCGVPILGRGNVLVDDLGLVAYPSACSIDRLVADARQTYPGQPRLFSQLDELRTEVQRRDQEILAMSAKMKTLEEQHQDYQRHIAVLKESLCAKEEHYNMLQADVSISIIFCVLITTTTTTNVVRCDFFFFF